MRKLKTKLKSFKYLTKIIFDIIRFKIRTWWYRNVIR